MNEDEYEYDYVYSYDDDLLGGLIMTDGDLADGGKPAYLPVVQSSTGFETFKRATWEDEVNANYLDEFICGHLLRDVELPTIYAEFGVWYYHDKIKYDSPRHNMLAFSFDQFGDRTTIRFVKNHRYDRECHRELAKKLLQLILAESESNE